MGRDRSVDWENLQKGHIPLEIPTEEVRGGYQPETSEVGSPPTGGGGGKEPEKSSE
jgi:hypothetical protein